VEFGLVIGFDRGEPGVEAGAAGEVRHHLGERPDVHGERVQVRALGADVLKLGRLAGLEAVWPGQEQPRDLPGLGHRGRRLCGGPGFPERCQVAADGLHAAVPALPAQLSVQDGGVADAVVPAAAEIGLDLVEFGFPVH
jgi:hypothetical protein